MNLSDIYAEERFHGLSVLAEKVGANAKFLYQCATGRRRPSPEMGWRLVDADPRLKFEDLYRDFGRPKRGASRHSAPATLPSPVEAKPPSSKRRGRREP